jgi:hypothetical protein
MFLSGFSIIIFTFPFTLGHDFNNGPMKKGCKRTFVKWIYKFFCSCYIAFGGMRTGKYTQDCDYSYYLGPNYKANYKDVKRASTVLPNHCSYLDPVIMIKYFCPAFAPNKPGKTLPDLGDESNVEDSIYFPSGGTQEKLDQALSIITER